MELEKILKTDLFFELDKNLLVGNESKDDAAVYDLGNGQAVISTTDFFTPIVDDPYDFGRIAATNALSDIYAMGGKPIMALAILGWPISKLPPEIARKVIEGARTVCAEAGIQLAGGHSIEIADPIFGLSVNGIVDVEKVKQNNTAKAGCTLFLTKPLGIGVMTTAEKKNLIDHKDNTVSVELMAHLNKVGYEFGLLSGVKAMTDVTGFGLIGHLLEICEGSGLKAELDYETIPKIEGVEEYIKMKSVPGGTRRNWNAYGKNVAGITEEQKALLCDPQTSGGLLVAVEDDAIEEFQKVAQEYGYGELKAIGKLVSKEENEDIYIEIK